MKIHPKDKYGEEGAQYLEEQKDEVQGNAAPTNNRVERRSTLRTNNFGFRVDSTDKLTWQDIILSVSGAVFVACYFFVTLYLFKVISLGEFFPVCGTGTVNCSCPDIVDGILAYARLFMISGVPFILTLLIPFWYFQGFSWKTIIVLCVMAFISFLTIIPFRNSPFSMQFTINWGIFVILSNCVYYYAGTLHFYI